MEGHRKAVGLEGSHASHWWQDGGDWQHRQFECPKLLIVAHVNVENATRSSSHDFIESKSSSFKKQADVLNVCSSPGMLKQFLSKVNGSRACNVSKGFAIIFSTGPFSMDWKPRLAVLVFQLSQAINEHMLKHGDALILHYARYFRQSSVLLFLLLMAWIFSCITVPSHYAKPRFSVE